MMVPITYYDHARFSNTFLELSQKRFINKISPNFIENSINFIYCFFIKILLKKNCVGYKEKKVFFPGSNDQVLK